MGVDTHTNLTSVIEAVTKQSCDTLLITGDLTHNGTLNSYQLLQRILTPIKSRIVVLGGNHDQIKNLNRVFSEQLITKFSLGNWEIIIIDSTQLSKTSGYVTNQALNQLDQDLKNDVFLNARDFFRVKKDLKNEKIYHHIGIYAFTNVALTKYVKLSRSKLEIERNLEQMRAMENNLIIKVGLCTSLPLGVDTKEDLIKIRKEMN